MYFQCCINLPNISICSFYLTFYTSALKATISQSNNKKRVYFSWLQFGLITLYACTHCCEYSDIVVFGDLDLWPWLPDSLVISSLMVACFKIHACFFYSTKPVNQLTIACVNNHSQSILIIFIFEQCFCF